MQRRLPKLALLLVSALALSALAGCGGRAAPSAPANDEVQLQYWTVFTGPDGTQMQNTVDAFNAANKSRIRVTNRVFASEEYYKTILAAMASGTPPDVCVMHCSQIQRFARKKLLLPLDATMRRLELSESQFIPIAWQAGEYAGQRYGVPIDVHPIGLYCNETLLRAKGFSSPPGDLQSFLKMAMACTYDEDGDGEPDVWGFAIDPNVMSEQLFWTLLYQYGGRAYDSAGSRAAYDCKAGEAALQLMLDLIYKYKVSPSNLLPDSALTMFKQGKLAFYMNGPWMLSELQDTDGLEFTTAPFPKLGGGSAVWADSHNLSIPVQRVQDPAKLRATETFIGYVLKNELAWAEAGHVPALTAVLNSGDFQKLTLLKGFSQQIDDIRLPSGTPYYDDIWSPAEDMLPDALLRRIPPKTMLSEAAETANANVRQDT